MIIIIYLFIFKGMGLSKVETWKGGVAAVAVAEGKRSEPGGPISEAQVIPMRG